LSPAGLCGLRTLDSTDACYAYATHKGANGGGRATNMASLRTFCAIAANVNSNWAPHGPRNRSRPSRRIRFKCANSISTRFLSRLDCLNASVLASARAASRVARNVLPVIREIQSGGVTSHRAVARSLNARGAATARGGQWTAVQVGAILQRI